MKMKKYVAALLLLAAALFVLPACGLAAVPDLYLGAPNGNQFDNVRLKIGSTMHDNSSTTAVNDVVQIVVTGDYIINGTHAYNITRDAGYYGAKEVDVVLTTDKTVGYAQSTLTISDNIRFTQKTGFTVNKELSGANFAVFDVASEQRKAGDIVSFIEGITFENPEKARIYLLSSQLTHKTSYYPGNRHFYQYYGYAMTEGTLSDGNIQSGHQGRKYYVLSSATGEPAKRTWTVANTNANALASSTNKFLGREKSYLTAIFDPYENTILANFAPVSFQTKLSRDIGSGDNKTTQYYVGDDYYDFWIGGLRKSNSTGTGYTEEWYWVENSPESQIQLTGAKKNTGVTDGDVTQTTSYTGYQTGSFYSGVYNINTKSNGEGTNTRYGYSISGNYNGNSDFVVYQNWTSVENCGTGAEPNNTGTKNSATDGGETAAEYYQGSNTRRWNDLPSGNTSSVFGYMVEFGDEINSDSDERQSSLTLDTRYAVTSGMDGYGIKTTNNQYVSYFADGRGACITLPDLGTQNGYTFIGWYDAAGNKVTTFEINTTEKKNVTYTARWIKDVTGTIYWDDKKNQDNQRPTLENGQLNGISLTLKEGGNAVSQSYSLTYGNDTTDTWTFAFEDVPVEFADSGAETTNYTVAMSETFDAYNIGTDSAWPAFILKHDLVKAEIAVSVYWDDDSDRDGLRQNQIVTLYADGVAADTYELSETTDSSNIQTYTFTPDKYKANAVGQEVVYTARIQTSHKAENYTYSDADEDTDIVEPDANNQFKLSHTPKTVDVAVEIAWEGDSKDYRPASLNLTWNTANALPAGVTLPTTVTATDGDIWTTVAVKVYAFNEGKPATYTVTPQALGGYTRDDTSETLTMSAGVNAATADFKLTLMKQDVTGTITWDDNSNQDGKRPTLANVAKLMSIDPAPATTLSGSGDLTFSDTTTNVWTYTFKNMPTHKAGTLIDYTVTLDDADDGYSQSKTENTQNYVLSYTPDSLDVFVNVIWEGKSGAPRRKLTATVNGIGDVEFAADYAYSPNSQTGLDGGGQMKPDMPRYQGGTLIDYKSNNLVIEPFEAGGTDSGYTWAVARKPEKYAENDAGVDPESVDDIKIIYTLTPNSYSLTLEDAEGVTEPTAYTYGQQDTLPTPEKEGYTFAGWLLGNDNIGTTVPEDQHGALTLQASWTAADYQVILNTLIPENNTYTPITYTYDNPPTLPQPTYTGYTFVGWYADVAYEKPVAVDGATSFVPSAVKDELQEHNDVPTLFLYARWTQDLTGYSVEWQDEKNQDGRRAGTQIKLYRLGKDDQGNEIEIPMAGQPEHWLNVDAEKKDGIAFNNVDVFVDGKLASYVVKADLVSAKIDMFYRQMPKSLYEQDYASQQKPSGRAAVTNEKEIVLYHAPEVEVFRVVVEWNDWGNRWNARPATLRVKLNADKSIVKPPEDELEYALSAKDANEEGNWTYGWEAQINPTIKAVIDPVAYDVELLDAIPEGYMMSEYLDAANRVKVITLTHSGTIPSTGDNSHLVLWGGLLALCLALLGVSRKARKS